MPLNPRLDFSLESLTGAVREQFDQLRRWFDNYESNGDITVQAFEGVLDPGDVKSIGVPGKLMGVTGFTTINGADPNGLAQDGLPVWVPMEYVTTTTTRIFFPTYAGSGERNSKAFTIVNGSSSKHNSYRVTAFYRG